MASAKTKRKKVIGKAKAINNKPVPRQRHLAVLAESEERHRQELEKVYSQLDAYKQETTKLYEAIKELKNPVLKNSVQVNASRDAEPKQVECQDCCSEPVEVEVRAVNPVHNMMRFSTGAVRSADRIDVRYDLFSAIAMRRLAMTYKEGQIKYGDHNWRKGMPISEILNHAIPHIMAYLEGDRTEDHLAHAAWNLFTALHSEESWPALNADLLAPTAVSINYPALEAVRETLNVKIQKYSEEYDHKHLPAINTDKIAIELMKKSHEIQELMLRKHFPLR